MSRLRGRLRHADTVVHEAGHTLALQRARVLVRIDRQVRQRVSTDRVQHPAVVLGDHLDVPVEQHPVARHGCVSIPERAPATGALGVLQDGHDAG